MSRAYIAAPMAAAYVATVVLANYLTEHYGLVPVGFGLLVTAGTFAAGATLLARNIGQDVIGKSGIAALMLVGVALSWWLASPTLAVASGVAFALSEMTDMAIYTALRRHGVSRAIIAAAAFSALVDTIAFLRIAGFPVTVDSVAGQWLVKVAISAAVAAIVGVSGAVLREPNKSGA